MAASINIDNSPVYTFPGSPANTSKWLAVNNPLIWEIKYTDGGSHTPPSGYQIQVIIENSTGTKIYKGYYTFGPDLICTIRLDAVLKTLVFLENTFEYDVINKKEARISHKFNLDIQGAVVVGTWEGGTETIAPFDLYILHSVRQIGCVYGPNMAEYVTQDNNTPLAKFLTFFDKPRYWEGYPFSLDFLYNHGDNTPGYSTNKQETEILQDGSTGTDAKRGLYSTERYYLNHAKLTGSYASNAKEVNVTIIGVSSDYPDILYTETKPVALQTFSNVNTIYLRWINELGGTDHWLFNVNQIKKISITDQKIAKLDVLNLVTSIGTNKAISNRKFPMYSIGTEPLTENEWDVLSRQLGGTIYCQVYDATLTKWYNAIVIPADYERNTKTEPYKIELNIILPEIFNQSL